MKVSERVPGIGETIRKGGTTPGHARTRGVGTGHPGPARSPRGLPLGIEYSQRDVVSSHRRTPATSPRRSAHQIGARRVPTGGEVPTLESFSRGGVRAASGPAAVYPAGRGILPDRKYPRRMPVPALRNWTKRKRDIHQDTHRNAW